MPDIGCIDTKTVNASGISKLGFVLGGNMSASFTGTAPMPTQSYDSKFVFRLWLELSVYQVYHPNSTEDVIVTDTPYSGLLYVGTKYGPGGISANQSYNEASGTQAVSFDLNDVLQGLPGFASQAPPEDPNAPWYTYGLHTADVTPRVMTVLQHGDHGGPTIDCTDLVDASTFGLPAS